MQMCERVRDRVRANAQHSDFVIRARYCLRGLQRHFAQQVTCCGAPPSMCIPIQRLHLCLCLRLLHPGLEFTSEQRAGARICVYVSVSVSVSVRLRV
eukprot:1564445-Alexandrium_andersonii.AAC.1